MASHGHPVVGDVFSGGGGGGPSTHIEGISSGKGLAVEMHLGSPGLNPGGRGWLKLAFHSVTCHFFSKSSFHHWDLLVLA